jgi:hypothetical protein
MPQFVTRVTEKEMKEQSKKATEEAMRQVANEIIHTHLEHNDDIYISSDESIEVRPKKRTRNSNEVEKLETQIHYLRLDMANKMIELDDCTNELAIYKKSVDDMKKINSEFDYLMSLHFYLNEINTLTIRQLEKKIYLYNEEEQEHAQLCMNSISRIEYPLIKKAMQLSLKDIRTNNKEIDKKLRKTLANKQFLDCLRTSIMYGTILVISSIYIVFALWCVTPS